MGTMARYSLITSCHSINIGSLVHGNCFSEGNRRGFFEHPSGFSVGIAIHGDTVALKYMSAGSLISEKIMTETTATNFNGRRRWFLCPRCCRRFAVLFLSRYGVRCRKCLHLVYPSSRERAFGRAQLKKERLLRKIGADSAANAWQVTRPKWMHHNTFERKKRELETVELEAGGAWMAQASSFLRRHGRGKRAGARV